MRIGLGGGSESTSHLPWGHLYWGLGAETSNLHTVTFTVRTIMIYFTMGRTEVLQSPARAQTSVAVALDKSLEINMFRMRYLAAMNMLVLCASGWTVTIVIKVNNYFVQVKESVLLNWFVGPLGSISKLLRGV